MKLLHFVLFLTDILSFILSVFHVQILLPLWNQYTDSIGFPFPLYCSEFPTLQWTLLTDRDLAVDTDLHFV